MFSKRGEEGSTSNRYVWVVKSHGKKRREETGL